MAQPGHLQRQTLPRLFRPPQITSFNARPSKVPAQISAVLRMNRYTNAENITMPLQKRRSGRLIKRIINSRAATGEIAISYRRLDGLMVSGRGVGQTGGDHSARALTA
ncbi:hypothetical protein B6E78_08510 [Edwardsiella ictaluri]|nr:hypothetical protein B6E78_08510 [Edwardsiella ictaluri]